MVKVVDNGERICTVTLDGSESSVVFQNDYRYFAVQNNSDTDINISLKRGFSSVDDGVMTVVAGSSVLFPHMRSNVNQFFVKGTGKIQVCATNEPINPFVNAPAKSSGGGIEGDYYTKAQSDAKYVQASSLAVIATSGRYSDLKGAPEKLPADGGNADTVGGYTVGCDVPENAVFTPPDLSGYALLTDVIPYRMGMDFGMCTTAAATISKVATTLNKVAPSKGAVFTIKFTNSVPAKSRLSVNGLTGYLYYKGSSISANIINAGDVVTFMYYESRELNIFEVLSIENGGNAKTVNGFTVGCNVPADAVFTPPDLSGYASKALYGDTTINVGRKAGSTVGENSTAEGLNTTASGNTSHAEGAGATASGSDSHAEGYDTTASNFASHAEGASTVASGNYSHAEGYGTIANNDAEHASGKYNVSNGDTLFSIGDGTAEGARHNAFEITKTGGKLHDRDIGVLFTKAESDAIRIEIPDSVDAAQWLVENAKNGMQYFISTRGSRTGLPNVSADWMWFSYDGNRHLARAWTGDTHTTDFVLDAVNSIGGWKEISYTPIKSTTISGTTNESGFFTLWSNTENKIPVAFRPISYPDMIFIPMFSTSNWTARCVHSDFSAFASAAIGNVKVFYIEN